MKRRKLTISILLILLLAAGCGGKDTNKDNTGATPSPGAETTAPETTGTQEETDEAAEEIYNLMDYYVLQPDTEYVFTGEGNEYASYRVYVDFLDANNNRVQTRTNNGGTETVRVIEVKDDKIVVSAIRHEAYYRDNLLDKGSAGEEEILLMEPLAVGTQWTLSDGRTRSITGTGVKVDSPSGSFATIEVTTASEDGSTVKDYYAPQMGPVKQVFYSKEGDMVVTSTLSEVNEDKPLEQRITVFYPDVDEKIYTEEITLQFRTNDITRVVLEETIKQEVVKDSYLPLITENTAINSMYMGDDNIAYIDFSKEFVTEMNAGAGYEMLLLQSVTNTLGNYYGVNKVYITVDGKPYESGHILMKQGEALEVNMDRVVTE